MIEFINVRDKAEIYYYPTFEATVEKTVENGKFEFPSKDFYVDIVWKLNQEKKEPEFLGIAFEACPTPHYNQTVYRYHNNSGELELLWTLPPEVQCIDMYQNRTNIGPEEAELLKYVLDLFDGTLFNLVNNRESKDGTRKFE